MLILAALIERSIFTKKLFSVKSLTIIVGIIIIQSIASTSFKEISTHGYQKLYQYVIADGYKDVKFKMAQEALSDNKINIDEYGKIMPSYTSSSSNLARNYPVPDDFKVSGQPQIMPLQNDDMVKWATFLHHANTYLIFLLVVTATIFLLSVIARKPIQKLLSNQPVVFKQHPKTIAVLGTLLISTNAALYFVPANQSSIQKVQQFVEGNKEITEIQNLYQSTNHGQNIHLIDLHTFKSMEKAVLVRQIKQSFK